MTSQHHPAQRDPAQRDPAQRDPAQRDPAQRDPAQHDPAQHDPAQRQFPASGAEPVSAPADRGALAAALTRYRVLASVVGVLLVVLCLVGLPLHYAHLVDPAWFPVGSTGEQVGDAIAQYLGVAHGWLYMVFVLLAFVLSRRAGWDLGFTLVTLVLGTVPVASFWAERRATRRVREQLAGGASQ